jgi:hypothetical protein
MVKFSSFDGLECELGSLPGEDLGSVLPLGFVLIVDAAGCAAGRTGVRPIVRVEPAAGVLLEAGAFAGEV